ncbi:tetratricopeptide repeat protein [Methanotorris igneus]|uniref:Tetratricopeptide TPR_2 repeat-containing protein n=1 Tax=Methanotorris igneus (strain DSM 5666 / JCM 11834 / Kol 5) TaxID=880724 RepID=F6BBY7_METIK|nr:tetratricopeptide repeat protein [Methanotorris igneus]AEF96068.1 Tetratricopeptide TPR_2 repeat-containing protein [Methanotorris igneus Kol 5]
MRIFSKLGFIFICVVVTIAGCVDIPQSSKNSKNEISPNVATAFNMYKEGRYQTALIYCDKAIKENPNDKWAWYLKGKIYYQLNESAKAVECFNKSIRIDPNFADAYFWMGLTYTSYYITNEPSHYAVTCDYKTARKYIGKAIELNPNKDIYYSYMAQCYILDDLDKSIEYINKAIELNPDNAYYWVQKADYLELKGKYKDALLCYDEALKIEPDNVDIMLKKAELYHRMGLTYKEKEILEEVEKIDPQKAELYRFTH